MRTTLILLSLITFISLQIFGETKLPDSTVVLRGRISNCSDSSLHLKYKDRNYNTVEAEVELDSAGNFYKLLTGIYFVQRVGFEQDNVSVTLLIAPGYNLEITGNGKDKKTFYSSYQIKGTGAGNNQYTKQLDSITRNNIVSQSIYNLEKEEYLPYLKSKVQFVDSFARAFFDKLPGDSYSQEFKNLVLFENEVIRFYFLTYYIVSFKVKPEEALQLVKSNVDPSLLDSLFKEEYLRSDIYVLTMHTNYLYYLLHLNSASGAAREGTEDPRLQTVATNYKGKIKDLVLHDLFLSKIESIVAYKKILPIKDSLTRYAEDFTNKSIVDSLQHRLRQKQSTLVKTKPGHPAPSFSLQSAEGKTYKLEDFRGKVVYIDLWASWCGPCREESPFLQKIYDRYKDNKEIAFISISIKDRKADWIRAIKEDKPAWLQLIDNNDTVYNRYNAITIPRFIIIDKEGNIVNNDAPRPRQEESLLSILNSEIGK